ncbi:MAG TPA: replication-associated recombination protein A, partial [Draconibacterium sp.]|nr:replication-associated recombination protein A [Draconibacterium sp.]
GPPGVGKTTLAKIIANTLERPFHVLSAINSGVKDIREVIDKAKKQQFFSKPNPILFIDEIHRFSKSQQDSLLGAVEDGTITLIGATTENPSFEVISPLLSRCQVYILESLDKAGLLKLIDSALKKDIELKKRKITIAEDQAMLRFSGGDARKLLNVLELVVLADENEEVEITNKKVLDRLQNNLAIYDKQGEMHYDIISAFIKSIRGSDPDAAVYWLARMLEGGEDIKFIARRLLILSAEDVGLANPNALLLAQSTFDAVHKIGMPEARIILSECVIYLATSPKSNSAYEAIDAAIALVKQTGDLPVPLHIRNAPTKLMKEIGYGKNYKYSHAFEGNFAEQDYLPEKIKKERIYYPQNNQTEIKILERLKRWWGERF